MLPVSGRPVVFRSVQAMQMGAPSVAGPDGVTWMVKAFVAGWGWAEGDGWSKKWGLGSSTVAGGGCCAMAGGVPCKQIAPIAIARNRVHRR